MLTALGPSPYGLRARFLDWVDELEEEKGRTMPNETLSQKEHVLDRRVPGASLRAAMKAVGIARMPPPREAQLFDARPDLEVLERVAAGLRAMDEER
jgi:hypothetical protein